MSWYIGFYRSGKTRVFQTSKKATKKSFPFYEKVMGPFESDEEAREEASRHRPRIGGVLDARRSNPSLIYCECGHPEKHHNDPRDRGRSNCLIERCNCLQFVPKKKPKKNPGAAWHRAEEDHARRLERTELEPKRRSFFSGARETHEFSAKRSEALGINPRRRNPGSDWEIYPATSHADAIDEVLKYRSEGKDAKVTFNPNSRVWEVWVSSERGENPRRDIDRFRPFRGGTPTYCKCGHLLDIHYKGKAHSAISYCKLCDCNKYITSRSRREILRKNPPLCVCGHRKVYHKTSRIVPSTDYCTVGDCSCRTYISSRPYKKRRELKKNPPGHKIYDNILAIEARKGKDSNFPSENFRHDFKGGATVEGMPDGSLRIRSKHGKRLWKNFNY